MKIKLWFSECEQLSVFFPKSFTTISSVTLNTGQETFYYLSTQLTSVCGSFPNFDYWFLFFLLESTPCPLWRSYCMLPDRCKVITKKKRVYISWFLFIVCTHRIFLLVDPKDAITFLEKTKEKVGLFTMKCALSSQFVTPRLLKYQRLSEDVLNVIV